MKKRSFWGPILLLSWASGCGPNQSSQVQHDFGKLTIGTEPVLWANISDDEFFKVVMPETPGFPNDAIQNQDGYFTKQDEIQRRMQFWLDQLDLVARQVVGDANAAGIPKPNLKLVKEDYMNAFVAPVRTCLTNVKVKIVGKTGNKILEKGGVQGNWIINTEGEEDNCVPHKVTSPADMERIVSYMKWRNDSCDVSGQSAAKDTYEIKVSQKPGANCSAISEADGIVQFNQLVQPATSNHIILNARAIVDYPEATVIFMMAHELAHYYRSHVLFMNDANQFGLFYKVGTTSNGKRPVDGVEPEVQSFKKEFLVLNQQKDALRMERNKYSIWDSEDPAQKDFPKKYDEISAKIEVIDGKLDQIVALALKNKIGWYTVEQEADEVGLEIYNRLGFTPQVAVDFALDQADFKDAVAEMDRREGWFDWRKEGFIGECHKLYNQQWMVNGQKQIQTIGDFKEQHHTACFRAYNLSLEIDGHAQDLAKSHGKLPQLPTDLAATPWSALQKIATDKIEEYTKIKLSKSDDIVIIGGVSPSTGEDRN